MINKALRAILAIIACAAVSLPLAFMTGILSAPFWDWFEARTGIESYGHSGPADWVFLTLWIVWSIALLALLALRVRRNRSNAPVSGE